MAFLSIFIYVVKIVQNMRKIIIYYTQYVYKSRLILSDIWEESESAWCGTQTHNPWDTGLVLYQLS